jgi:transposase
MAGGRPFEIDWKDDEQTLYELYKKERDWQDRRRLQALWLLRKGRKLAEVAEIVGVHYRTVQEWVKWYRQGGLEEVRGHRLGAAGGAKARLEGEELEKLKAKVEQGEFKTIWEAVKWVKDEFKVEYSYWGMRWVFKRLKLKKKVPRPQNPKASVEKQQAWKESGLGEKLEEVGYGGREGLYWADEMRVGLIGQVRRVWAPVGVKIVQKLQYTYEWEYLNLAVNGLTGQLAWGWTENMKGASIVEVVKVWAEQQVKIIVWDRAPGHRGEVYQNIAVKRIEQPPYSPELNPAERVFELLRDKIEGKIYETITAKKEAVEAELKELAAFPERVKRLAGWAWIQQAVAGLPS